MKQQYLKPEMLVEQTMLTQVIALSIVDDEADPGGEVLGKDRRGFADEEKNEFSKKLWE